MGNRNTKVRRGKIPNSDLIDVFRKPDDIRNVPVNLGFRFIFAIISVALLGFSVNQDGKNFLVSMTIFAIPLLREYLSFTPKQTIRKSIRRLQLVMFFSIVLIAALNFMTIIEVVLVESSSYLTFNPLWGPRWFHMQMDLIFVWVLAAMCALLTGLDWFIYKPIQEGEPPNTSKSRRIISAAEK